MMRALLFLPILLAPCLLALGAPEGGSWPAFRGGGNSHTGASDLPLRWSESENVAWRAELAGFGQSSPVLWDDRVYVTSTAGDRKERLLAEAFDLAGGERLWRAEFAASQRPEEVSNMISRGAPTPAADADGVYLFYESGDLIALDHGGEVRWRRSLTEEYGEFGGGHGIGTSLVNAPGSLVLLIEHEGPSYLLCVDKATGENLWRVEREPRVSWTTPLLVEHEGVAQIVVSSNGVLESYRLEDGGRLWWVEGLDGNTVASPSVAGDLVVIGSSDPNNSLAVELGGSGDVSDTHVEWRAESVTSSFGSPLVHGETVHFVNRAGALQATNLEDGSLRWERRIPDSCWASPLSAGDRLYFFCKNGHTVVLEAAEGDAEPEQLAENVLEIPEGDRVYGFAVAPGRFVLRTSRGLVAVGEGRSAR